MPGGGAVSGRRAVFSTPLRRSNRAEKPRRSAKTVCVSAKRRTMRCVSPHVSPQVVEKFCPLVWEMGKRIWACAGVACPALPLLSPAGAWRFWSPVDFAAVVPEGVACLLCRLPTTPLACFPTPYPPDPLPQRGRGRLKVYFAGGSAPGTPALNRLRHLQNLPSKCPAAEIRGLPQKRQEAVPYEQCRQPRRGGTGGDGTIRRTRRRRLRWSSPPGQVEQMPHGGAGKYAKGGGWQAAKRENFPP